MKLQLKIIKTPLTIHRLNPNEKIPTHVLTENFFSICKTEEEISIVCPSHLIFDSGNKETGWVTIQVVGPLHFSLTGILADITTALANSSISIFAISTFDTDYILIKEEAIIKAKSVLENEGHFFI